MGECTQDIKSACCSVPHLLASSCLHDCLCSLQTYTVCPNTNQPIKVLLSILCCQFVLLLIGMGDWYRKPAICMLVSVLTRQYKKAIEPIKLFVLNYFEQKCIFTCLLKCPYRTWVSSKREC